jgi:DNA-binding NarL/FixJ family response regulator
MLSPADEDSPAQANHANTCVRGEIPARISVLVVEDDQALALALIPALLQHRVEAVVKNNLACARGFLTNQGKVIDAVLLGSHLPDGRGDELLAEIEALPKQPGIVMFNDSLSDICPDLTSYRVVWTPKSTPPSALASMLRQASRGYAHTTLHRFARRFQLTGKEIEVLDRVAKGSSPKNIALDDGCSLQAVYAHLAKLSTKVGCMSYHEVVAKLFQFSCHGLGHEVEAR